VEGSGLVLGRWARDAPANTAIVSWTSKSLSHKLSLIYESVNPDCSSGPIISRMFSRPASICAGEASRQAISANSDYKKNSHTELLRSHVISTIGKGAIVALFCGTERVGTTTGLLARESYSPSRSRFLTNLCLDMTRIKRFARVLRMVINGIL
jgi:hypothetical protein